MSLSFRLITLEQSPSSDIVQVLLSPDSEALRSEAHALAFDGFRSAVEKRLARTDRLDGWMSIAPKVAAAEKAMAECQRDVNRVAIDRASVMDALSGEELVRTLAQLEAREAELRTRLAESAAGFRIVAQDVARARVEVNDGWLEAVYEEAAMRRHRITSSLPSLDQSFTSDRLSAVLVGRYAHMLLGSDRDREREARPVLAAVLAKGPKLPLPAAEPAPEQADASTVNYAYAP